MKLSELMIEPEVTLELAPLIDVLFLIVLFYAVSSSLISPDDLARLKGHVATADTENRTLIEKVETQAAQLAQVRTDLDRRGADVASRDARIGRLEADLQASAAEVTRRGAEITEARGRAGQLEADLKAGAAQLAQRGAEAAAAQTRIDQLRSDVAAARTQAAEQTSRLEKLGADLAAREQALAAQAQRIVIMDHALDDMRTRLAQSQTTANQQAQQAATAQAAVAKLETESRQLADQLRTEKAGHESDLAAAKAELDRLRVQVAGLTAENAKFQDLKKTELDRVAGMAEAQKRLTENLKALVEDKSLGIEQVNDRLVLELSDKILFDSGSDQLRPQGLPVLANVAKVLASRVQTLQIQVGGHTDNVPLGPGGHFGSNWALSAARAVNVVRFFETSAGIDPGRLSAVGYGEYQPIAANTTPEGRARNRRIEIVLLAK